MSFLPYILNNDKMASLNTMVSKYKYDSKKKTKTKTKQNKTKQTKYRKYTLNNMNII
jgi:hypothetical protein